MTVTDNMYQVEYLPPGVTQVRKDVIKSFSHSKRVGGYLLGRTLGVGSFAKVKEGLHLSTGEKVAVKVIDKKRAKTDNYVRKNLRREGKLLQMVRHPNVIALFEVMETDNSYYLVTELCRGGDLMDYITSRKRLPESEVTKFIRQIVSAVDYLHRLGIIHRDLKIENLLLDGNKDIKLIDFGLSNFIKVSTSPEGTRASEFCVTQCGSPAYAAPELLNHEKYGLQVDLWSIGVNMYAMLTGGLPFTVEPFNIKALYAKMKDRQMNPVPDDLSRDCRDLLRKFLNPDPARRMTIGEALMHPWLTQGSKSVPRPPCPNKMKTSDLEADILSHMAENLGFRMGEVIKFVTCNTPSQACATYHLFLLHLERYKAEVKASGAATPTSRTSDGSRSSVGDSKVTLHLQEVRSKPKKDGGRGLSTPTPRMTARGDSSTDRKENQNPSARSESPLATLAVTRTESKAGTTTASSMSNRNVQRRHLQEPLAKVNTQMGATSHRGVETSELIPLKPLIDDKLALDAQKRLVLDVQKRIHQTHFDKRGKIHYEVPMASSDLESSRVSVEGDNITLNTARSVNFQQQHRLLSKRGVAKSIDPSLLAVPGGGSTAERSHSYLSDGSSTHAHFPKKQQVTPRHRPGQKQYVPFRSAQDRQAQRFTGDNHYSSSIKPPQKSKTTESMSLHGKNMFASQNSTAANEEYVITTNNAAHAQSHAAAAKRPVSPHRPIAVRRRLVKRHRIGNVTPPSGDVIQDVDEFVTTDLKGDHLGQDKVIHSIPLPSISPNPSRTD